MDLPALPDGAHSVTVALTWTGNVRGYPSNNETVYFRIDSNEPEPPPITVMDSTSPKISLLAPMGVYNSYTVPLSFTLYETISKAYYSLDGMDNITVNGNITLTGIASGEHSLILYAEDGAGNVGTSETAFFTVAEEMKQQPQQPMEPFPIELVLTVPAAFAVTAGIILLFHFKKRKR
jgi:hypothetical protein